MSLFREEVFASRKGRLHGEVVLSQPLSTRLFVAVLFSVIAIAGIWVTIGTYARIETVSGILVTDVPSANVVAVQGGTISELVVTEGRLVEAGERLAVVDSARETRSGGDVAGRGLDAIDARRQLSLAQVALARSRGAAERSRLLTIMSAAEARAGSLQGQIQIQQDVVKSNQDLFDKLESVMERGFVSRVEYERRRQTLLGSRQTLAGLQQQLSGSLAEAEQARSQLATIDIEAAQGVSQIQEDLHSLTAEEARLQGEQSYVITAPITGRVTALATGIGRPANPGRPLMVIVPEDATLEAELYAPSRAVGFVEPGKETRLLYDAFPYQRFGSFTGTIASISRIAVDPRETEIPFPFEEPVYRVRVALDRQAVRAFGRDTPLQPGMTLKANIVLERQSFLSWLLQPLRAVLNRNA